ncbi:MAG: hypothetical protein A2X94_13325 [Bdellovibrionales bacterium GWB1_55_8]|nr:MAG: hypothetical protein A2X94_13325 [Bdellovibrionales bacterium GWB1_55_8]
MGKYSRDLGIRAEEDALVWLLNCYRMRLLLRNFRCKVGEIDLILEEELPDGERELVFVEIRSRAEGSWVSALESVSFSKRRKLKRAIGMFLLRYDGRAKSARVDVLAQNGGAWEHIRNIRMDL